MSYVILWKSEKLYALKKTNKLYLFKCLTNRLDLEITQHTTSVSGDLSEHGVGYVQLSKKVTVKGNPQNSARIVITITESFALICTSMQWNSKKG